MAGFSNISINSPQIDRTTTRSFAAARKVMDKVADQASLLFSNLNEGYNDLDKNPDTLTISDSGLRNYSPIYTGFISYDRPAGGEKELKQVNILADSGGEDGTTTYYGFSKTDGVENYEYSVKLPGQENFEVHRVTHNVADETISYTVDDKDASQPPMPPLTENLTLKGVSNQSLSLKGVTDTLSIKGVSDTITIGE